MKLWVIHICRNDQSNSVGGISVMTPPYSPQTTLLPFVVLFVHMKLYFAAVSITVSVFPSGWILGGCQRVGGAVMMRICYVTT